MAASTTSDGVWRSVTAWTEVEAMGGVGVGRVTVNNEDGIGPH